MSIAESRRLTLAIERIDQLERELAVLRDRVAAIEPVNIGKVAGPPAPSLGEFAHKKPPGLTKLTQE